MSITASENISLGAFLVFEGETFRAARSIEEANREDAYYYAITPIKTGDEASSENFVAMFRDTCPTCGSRSIGQAMLR